MGKGEAAPPRAAALRLRAEERLISRARRTLPLGEADAQRLLDELEIHEVELELQNEELRATRLEAERAAERYQELYDFAPLGCATLACDGTIRSVNMACARLLGRERSRLVSKPFALLLAQRDRSAFTGLLAGAAERRGEGAESRELSLAGGPGDRIICVSAAALGDPAREILLTIQDITEWKQAEERLSSERERLAVTVESIGDAVIATDAEGRVALFNRVAEQLTGWTAAEAVGRPIQEVFRIVCEDTRAPAVNPVDRALREGAVVGLANHTALVARDGVERPIADSGAPIRDSRGQIAGAVLVFRDQTEERRAERALRESEVLHRILFEQAPVGVAQVDTATGRFLRVNRAFCDMLGRPRDEVLAGTWRAFTHPDDLPANVIGVRRMEVSSEPYHCEKRYLRKDGSEVWASTTVRPMAVPGCEFTAQIAVAADLTERREAERALRASEERLRQAQKLESIGRLAGGIAHDFNNLLTVILTCADSLGEEVGNGGTPNGEDVAEIQAAARRARDLTRQLLAFARKQVIAPVPLDLNDVVRGSEKLLRRILGEDISLVVTLASDLWLARCDPGQMEQVVLNLAVNARDAMPRGGTLFIETGGTRLDEESGALGPGDVPGEYVRLVMRDSGVGMSDEVKAHLFEPFFTTKPIGQGTGLGLATVYGIVKQSAGHVRVHSAPARGTTIEILLPRTLDAAPPAASPAPLTGRGTESVLLVEDDPQVREVTIRSLRGGGYRVVVAASPREALDLPIDELRRLRLLVTDVVMPGLDGRALAEELRRRHARLRVLYVSGYARDAITERGILEPGVEFLEKPFTGPALLARVRAVLDAN